MISDLNLIFLSLISLLDLVCVVHDEGISETCWSRCLLCLNYTTLVRSYLLLRGQQRHLFMVS